MKSFGGGREYASSQRRAQNAAMAQTTPQRRRATAPTLPTAQPVPAAPDLPPGASVELLKALHILTRDGQLNQDSRRKLKQVAHLVRFIEPLVIAAMRQHGSVNLVDHGAGKSYLGFILYDRLWRGGAVQGTVWGVEARAELVERSRELALRFGFDGMRFLDATVAQAQQHDGLPQRIDIVTALHACDTATDDAISFALARDAQHLVLVPCCQAEMAAALRANKALAMRRSALSELWRHPLHTREFGSQITNVLRCLRLEAHGYQVSVTELVGWEHSMKNELIVASRHPDVARGRAARRIGEILDELGTAELRARFAVPEPDPETPA